MPDNSPSNLEAKFHLLDMSAINALLSQTNGRSSAPGKMQSALTALEASANSNQDLRKNLVDVICEAVKSSLRQFVKRSEKFPATSITLNKQIQFLDERCEDYASFMEPLSGKNNKTRDKIVTWSKSMGIDDQYSQMWNMICADQAERAETLDAATNRIKDLYILFAENGEMNEVNFVRMIVDRSRISDTTKNFHYSGFSQHLKSLGNPEGERALHLIDLKKKKNADEETESAKFYAGIADVWFNGPDFSSWRDNDFSASAKDLDALKEEHARNKAILEIFADDPFPSLNIDAEFKRIDDVFKEVLNKKTKWSSPFSVSISKSIGKSEMNKALVKAAEGTLQLARKHQIERQKMIDDRLKVGGRLWISFHAIGLSKDELQNQMPPWSFEEKLARYDAAMHDLRPDGKVPDKPREDAFLSKFNWMPPKQLEKYKEVLEELRSGDIKCNTSLGLLGMLSRRLLSIYTMEDRHNSDYFTDLHPELHQLHIAKIVYQASDNENDRESVRSIARHYAKDIHDKALSNIKKREDMIAAEIETCKERLGNLSDAADPLAAPEESTANTFPGSDRLHDIFVRDFTDCMLVWERETGWRNNGISVLGNEFEPFKPDRTSIHFTSTAIKANLKSLGKANAFMASYPKQSKQGFFLEALESAVATVTKLVAMRTEANSIFEETLQNEPHDEETRRAAESRRSKIIENSVEPGLFASSTDYDMLQSMAEKWDMSFDENQFDMVEKRFAYLRNALFEKQSQWSPQNPSDRIQAWVTAVTNAQFEPELPPISTGQSA